MPFLVEAAAGESLLASEVAAPMFAADASFVPAAGALGELGAMPGMEAMGGLGGLLGGGASFAGTGLGAGGLEGGLGSITASAAPEATAQVQSALQAAQTGANQIANPVMSEAQRRFLETSVAGNAADADVLERLAQGRGSDEIARLGGVEPGSAMDKPYVLTQTPTPNLPPAMTMEGVDTATPGGGISDLFSKVGEWWDKQPTEKKLLYGGAGLLGANALFGSKPGVPAPTPYSGPLSKFKYDPSQYTPTMPTPPTPYTPVYRDYRNYAGGGTVEAMSNANAIGANTGYPMADINKGAYATPWQTPISRSVLSDSADTGVNPITGDMTNFAGGGIASLGAYSDGGQMLKGPGDGMSDSIPATIAGKQPARLANDEFVVPADVVSHLGNGSSDAGAKQLYKMMDKVRQARTGTKKQGKQINPDKYLPT
mgnify:CR=1 FL=1